jgi:hypothetical protein
MLDVSDDVRAATELLLAGIAAVGALNFAGLNQAEWAIVVQVQELARRQMSGVDNVLVAELSEQITVGRIPARHAPDYLMSALRLSRSEAGARVRAAVDLGPRRGLTGDMLQPLFPLTAAAQAAGEISGEHSRVIRRAITDLPPDMQAEHFVAAERILVEAARHNDPQALMVAAYDLVNKLDPDGAEPREERQYRRRHFGLRRNQDGSTSPFGRFTAELTAKLEAVLSPLSAPRAGEDSLSDTRSVGQRQHDALDEMTTRMLRTGDLPVEAGIPATVYITMTKEDLDAELHSLRNRAAQDEAGAEPSAAPATGSAYGKKVRYARTSTGTHLSIAQALRLAADANLMPFVLDKAGVPLDAGYTSRCATPPIRHAANIRDQGCVFPGCTIPPEWCQAHHIIPWWNPEQKRIQGKTKLRNLALLCGFHHRIFEQWGWIIYLAADGIPTWVPPAAIDPQRKPVRNTAHHHPLDYGVAATDLPQRE